MIGMSNRKGRKRKIVNSPLRLFDASPIRKAARSSFDDQVTKSKHAKSQKRLSAELDHVSNKRCSADSASSSDELISPIATKSFYNKDASSKYLTPLDRKTQRDLLEIVSIQIPDKSPQNKSRVSVTKSAKTHCRSKRVTNGSTRPKVSSKPQKPVSPTNETNDEKTETKENCIVEGTLTKYVSARQSPRKNSNSLQSSLHGPDNTSSPNEHSPNKVIKGHGSPRRSPRKERVYHKGTPKSKTSKKSNVTSTAKSAQKGIQMYVLGLGKGKKSKHGKAAKELEKVMKQSKKKCRSQDSLIKRSCSFEEELKIEGIEPLESNVRQSPKKIKNISPQKPSPRRSPRKSVKNLDNPDKYKETKQENIVTETPESLSHQSQSPTRDKLISDITPKKASVKLFPVFTPPTSPNSVSAKATSTPKSTKKGSRVLGRHLISKLKDKRGLEQMTLDAGQKKFGALKCQTCGMVYTAGHPEDEADHAQFHKKFLTFVKFPGWKIEHVLDVFDDGRIIQITDKDPKYCKKKVEEVRELVDHALGFPDGGVSCKSSTTTLLFISIDNKVAGCLIAEEIKEGYRVIPDSTQEDPVVGTGDEDEKQKAWCCSNVAQPVMCGISRIWATGQMRRMNIASRMVDCLRMNYIFGTTLGKDDIAFSDPTPDGKLFASKYCGTKSFLVYKYR